MASPSRAARVGVSGEKLKETPGAKAGETTTTAKYDRKLVEILRAATEIFAEVGYDPASIRMVADRAGVSVPGLYYYVRSKEELLYLIQYRVFDDLVRRYDEDRERILGAGGEAATPEARLRCFIHNHLSFVLADLPSLTVCTRELGRLGGDYLRQVEALQRRYFSQAFEIFQELSRRYRQIDPRSATLAMFGAINWVSTWYNPASDKSADELTDEFASLFLWGVSSNDECGAATSRRGEA